MELSNDQSREIYNILEKIDIYNCTNSETR